MTRAKPLDTDAHLNAALYRAVQVVLASHDEMADLDCTPETVAEQAEDLAQVAALDALAGLVQHPILRQTVARAFAAEACRLVRIGTAPLRDLAQ